MNASRCLKIAAGVVMAAALGSSLVAAELGQEKTFTNSLGMKFVRIPAGEFMMGAEETPRRVLKAFPYCDPAWLDGESPRHKVRLSQAFFIGQHEVTLEQFMAFCKRAGYRCDAETDGKLKWGYDKNRRLVE